MSEIDKYLQVLKKIQNSARTEFQTKRSKAELIIDGHTLRLSSSIDLMREPSKNDGVLVKSLSDEMKRNFIEKGVSFLTLDGELYLAQRGIRFALLEKVKPAKERRISLGNARGPSPTTFISPNGLMILDALFSHTAMKIQTYSSALKFVKEFGLNQSKLSLMMKAMNCKHLNELRGAIQNLSYDWWSTALRYPMTKKGLQPFFEIAQPYFEMSPGEKSGSMGPRIASLRKELDLVLVGGPGEVPKSQGLLKTQDVFLWGSRDSVNLLKKKMKLVPGQGMRTWYIAVPKRGLENQALFSRVKSDADLKENRFRAVWDLGFGDARMKEIQVESWIKLLNEY
jgi:hypothetical protein